MASLALYLFGPPCVMLDDEVVVDFRSEKARALLIYLALEADRPHRRDALAGLFWPNVSDHTARRNLRLTLHRLRDTLNDQGATSAFFHITRETVQCRPENVWVDARAFEALLRQIRNHSHPALDRCPQCVTTLADAVALYRGDFLQEFALPDSFGFSEWVIVHRERWHRQALAALYHLAEYHRRRGNLETAERYARQQLELEPWREEAHRQLMDILARRGETSAALAQYHTCCRVLARELGVEPDEETRRTYLYIRHMRDRPASSLPLAPTSFVGREEELAHLAELLTTPECRLITLVGAPGIGKTRLALEAARAHQHAFLHGVHFIPLARANTPHLVPALIADALDLRLQGRDVTTSLIASLRRRELLLVLDNIEHLLTPHTDGDTRTFLVRLLEAAPHVKLLVTSRQRLNLRLEWVLALDGLPYPPAPSATDASAYPAVQLFVARARQARWNFAPQQELGAIVRICRLVEGMPLGIELAATWVRELPCADIADYIQENLDFLASTFHDQDTRHHSLRAAFEHSWELLSPEEQRAFRQLSVFRGGFLAHAAAYVARVPCHVLSSLVDKSLLRKTFAGRYEMHGLLREYAARKLAAHPDEEQATRRRHAAYYISLLQDYLPALLGGEQQKTLAALQEDMGNVRAAWEWAVQHRDAHMLDQAMDGLYHVYELRCWFQEGARAFRQAVAVLEEAGSPLMVGRALVRLGWFYWRLGQYAGARALLQPGLARLRAAGQEEDVALGLGALGLVCHNSGDYEQARQLYEESLAIYKKVGNQWGTLRALCRLGLLLHSVGEHALARDLFHEALHISRTINDGRGIAFTLAYLGLVTSALGDHEQARAYCDEGLRLCQAMGDHYGQALCLSYLGIILGHLQEYAQAREQLLHARDMFQELGDTHAVAYTLEHLGHLARQAGDEPAAAHYYRESFDCYRAIGSRAGMERIRDILVQLASSIPPGPTAAAPVSRSAYPSSSPVPGALSPEPAQEGRRPPAQSAA